MSSSEDGGGGASDDEHRMAFTADNDYEDGQWIGGEFYARGQKRGRRQTREESVYGVFAEDEDDEDAMFRQRKRDRKGKGGGGRGRADLTKPVNFVGGTREQEPDFKPATIAKLPTTNADFRAFLMKGLQAAASTTAGDAPAAAAASETASIASQEAGDGGAAAAAAAAAPPPPKKPAKLDAGFGGWEKHTKGIGLKLMQKMGFTGRLGKHETGVTRQLEVKVRPGGIGLGFGNFKEATTLRVNREIEADRQGKTLEELEKELGIERTEAVVKPGEARREAADAAAAAGLWRKGAAAKRSKRRYVTAEELLAAAERDDTAAQHGSAAAAPPQQVIVDMRGPTVKLLSGADEISGAA
ncbi:hypothetical protein JKP88DRAFT_336071, partial [Tribonema minus]